MTDTLFEMRSEEAMRREAVAENARRIHEAIVGEGPWELSARQRKILECLRGRQGKRQAMGIAEIAERTGAGPREIKGDVRELVMNWRLPIVASRDGEAGGYYFATTVEERIEGSNDYLKEAVKLLERVAVIRNEPDLMRWLGQQLIEEAAR